MCDLPQLITVPEYNVWPHIVPFSANYLYVLAGGKSKGLVYGPFEKWK
jgi:hypothetical protein